MAAILHDRLTHAPWMAPKTRRLPGTQPLDLEQWLAPDPAYDAQVALRDTLVAEQPEAVVAEGTGAASLPLLDFLLPRLAEHGLMVSAGRATRPDAVTVPLDRTRPMATLARLTQQDICLMERRGAEHVLTAAALCFPARWRMAEKLDRPLTTIHDPVPPYDPTLARRVQRLFDGLRPGTGLWRANAALTEDPALFQPEPNYGRRQPPTGRAGFVRSEWQALVKLPEGLTGVAPDTLVFTILTRVIRLTDLTLEQEAALADHPISESG